MKNGGRGTRLWLTRHATKHVYPERPSGVKGSLVKPMRIPALPAPSTSRRSPSRLPQYGDSPSILEGWQRLQNFRGSRPIRHGIVLANLPITENDHPFRKLRDVMRSEEHTSELQSPVHLVCRLLLEKKKQKKRGKIEGKKKEEKSEK